ncbi:AraC family transcriptional regulator [Leucobacter sp. USHLN153]|uniref:AraC family transcriptional regulator n=1 Tax=Leucobacter sp. USHLN153 TaxID=3081268 RepID=UPI003019899B
MTPAFLSDFPIAHASSTGRLRDAVDGVTGYDHAVTSGAERSGRVRGTVNGLRIGALSLVYVAYAAPVSVVGPPAKERVVLVVPLGPMQVEVAGHRQVMTAPFVLSGTAQTRMIPDPTAGALVGVLALSTVTTLLRDALGAERECAVDLGHSRPIELHGGTRIRRTWANFAQQPTSDAEALVDALLMGLAPVTMYGGGEAFEPSPPSYLLEAARYLRRYLSEPITIESLGSTVGIGTRQLQLAFQAHLGCTAQEYLRNARLDRAWAALNDSRPGRDRSPSVATVAAEVGIPHTGRFARYFSDRFGVLPSELRG